MRKEPRLSDFIYEEIRQCEEYALLNLITYEAAIRNPRLVEMLAQLDSVSSEERLDTMLSDEKDEKDKYIVLNEELEDEYFFDYQAYVDYTRNKKIFLENYTEQKILDPEYQKIIDEHRIENDYKTDDEVPSVEEQVKLYKKKQEYTLIVNYVNNTSHTLAVPLYRPKMAIPQKDSNINIIVPMYHIHPDDITAYYERLMKAHKDAIVEAKEYYEYEGLFYDEVDETKNKAETYAMKFFVWDYVSWWKQENGTFTPEKTSRGLYAKISEEIGATVSDKTGRSPKVEKYLEAMTGLVEKSGYKKFYIPKS